HISASLPSELRMRSRASAVSEGSASKTPSAPIPKWRSHSRTASSAQAASERPWPLSSRSTSTKSFPRPCIFTKSMTGLLAREVARHAVDDRALEVRAKLVPLEAGVAPQPSILPPREGVRAILDALDGVGQGEAPVRDGDQLAIAGGGEAR